jgi:membrane-bound lytic murein transglycosylase B
MKLLSIPTGRIEIELYRQKCLYAQVLTRKAHALAAYSRFIVVSAFLTILPVVGTPTARPTFPETRNPIVFTQDSRPVAGAKNLIAIVPGESRAQQAERERKEAELAKARHSTVPLRTHVARARYEPCPDSFRSFYQEIGPRFGVPWQVIEAIHQVESGKSCHTNRTSYAGAVGPMQFLPSTWRRYQWDCTGDGIADITNAFDAICTGAHYIGTGLTGFPLERAIFSYNRSWAYVDKVLKIARELEYEG